MWVYSVFSKQAFDNAEKYSVGILSFLFHCSKSLGKKKGIAGEQWTNIGHISRKVVVVALLITEQRPSQYA